MKKIICAVAALLVVSAASAACAAYSTWVCMYCGKTFMSTNYPCDGSKCQQNNGARHVYQKAQ